MVKIVIKLTNPPEAFLASLKQLPQFTTREAVLMWQDLSSEFESRILVLEKKLSLLKLKLNQYPLLVSTFKAVKAVIQEADDDEMNYIESLFLALDLSESALDATVLQLNKATDDSLNLLEKLPRYSGQKSQSQHWIVPRQVPNSHAGFERPASSGAIIICTR